MISSILLLAQETGTAYAMKMSGAHDTGQISVLSLFLKGGYILIPIVLLSIVSVYLIVRKSLDIKEQPSYRPRYGDAHEQPSPVGRCEIG